MSKSFEDINDELTIREDAYELEQLEDFIFEDESYSEDEQERILSASLGTDPAWCPRHDEFDEFVDYLGLYDEEDEYDEEDGQPYVPHQSEYDSFFRAIDEWQDYMDAND